LEEKRDVPLIYGVILMKRWGKIRKRTASLRTAPIPRGREFTEFKETSQQLVLGGLPLLLTSSSWAIVNLWFLWWTSIPCFCCSSILLGSRVFKEQEDQFSNRTMLQLPVYLYGLNSRMGLDPRKARE
jgi:hypothetical protein